MRSPPVSLAPTAAVDVVQALAPTAAVDVVQALAPTAAVDVVQALAPTAAVDVVQALAPTAATYGSDMTASCVFKLRKILFDAPSISSASFSCPVLRITLP